MSRPAPITDAAPVRAGDDLDWDAVDAYLRRHLEGLTGEPEILQFTNGAANLTYLLRYGDARLVLRRPPFGELAPGAHDMRREYRVLARIADVYGKAPRARLFCDDPSVAGADFFVMDYRDGVVIRDGIPEALRFHADLGRRVGNAVVDAVAELHVLEPAAHGLTDLGKPDGFVARQVAGWAQRWDRARPQGATRLMDELGERLARSVPAAQRTSVLHNDLHLGNCQFDPDDPDRVKSLFDWDMATLGDPLVDFGALLAYWEDPDDLPSASPWPIDPALRLPSRREAATRYAAATGLDLSEIDWYQAFARWRIATIMQQLHNRWVRGQSSNERISRFGDEVPRLAEAARDLLAGASSPPRPTCAAVPSPTRNEGSR